MRWAVYSPMGLPCHCHPSNAPHITSYHGCDRDGLCMNMSGVPQAFIHSPSLACIVISQASGARRQCRSVSQSSALVRTEISQRLLDGRHSWSQEGESWCLWRSPKTSYIATMKLTFVDLSEMSRKLLDRFAWNLVHPLTFPLGPSLVYNFQHLLIQSWYTRVLEETSIAAYEYLVNKKRLLML